MDVYTQSVQALQELPGTGGWNELQELYRRLARGKPRHWTLPVKACQAVGGRPEQAILAMVATACSHISIILVDDMLDDDPRGEYRRVGTGAAANLACAFQAAGLAAITHYQGKTDTKIRSLESMNRMILTTSLGQAWDVSNPQDEAAYWRIVETKSSPFFGTALQIGALIGGAPDEVADLFYRVGALYGEMIQIHDDMGDTLEVPANADWTQHRSPLPILFARSVAHPDRERFLELLDNVKDINELQEAQRILIRCGAISYCVDQLMRRHQKAENILETMTLARQDTVSTLFEEVISPVVLLLRSAAGWQTHQTITL
jgi:geranylgeranyl pyrophosphate synthase